MSVKNVVNNIKKSGIKWIRLQFCNPFGLLHQLSVPAEEITEEAFVTGFPLDGSSILGFTDIDKSDIILVPDHSTFTILPDYFDTFSGDRNYYLTKSARMFVNVHKGLVRDNILGILDTLHKKQKILQKNVGLIKPIGQLNWNFSYLTKSNKFQKLVNQIFQKSSQVRPPGFLKTKKV